MSVAAWSVRELAEQAGTTVRTIHYYISEGLLPPPAGATRSATYSEAHLARLRLIGALRDEGLALASIRQRLAPLSDEQALDVVADLDEHLAEPEATPLTTLGLIEAALASRAMEEEVTSQMTTVSRVMPSPATAPYSAEVAPSDRADSASEYLKRVLRKPAPRPEQPVPMPRPMPRPAPPQRPQLDTSRPETWHYYQIEDGIELRVREDRYRESKGRLLAVIDTLKTSLRRYGLADPRNDV
ncbi:MAG TPA: MerR family transcriptional regulator [Thermomicrobiales bacterium]|nr:MerR family transcriptional regulator [Thermomicrobiales bacterium]